jgi:hypothetical protein
LLHNGGVAPHGCLKGLWRRHALISAASEDVIPSPAFCSRQNNKLQRREFYQQHTMAHKNEVP